MWTRLALLPHNGNLVGCLPINHTGIIDLHHPEEAIADQRMILSTYPGPQASIDMPLPPDFVRIPICQAEQEGYVIDTHRSFLQTLTNYGPKAIKYFPVEVKGPRNQYRHYTEVHFECLPVGLPRIPMAYLKIY